MLNPAPFRVLRPRAQYLIAMKLLRPTRPRSCPGALAVRSLWKTRPSACDNPGSAKMATLLTRYSQSILVATPLLRVDKSYVARDPSLGVPTHGKGCFMGLILKLRHRPMLPVVCANPASSVHAIPLWMAQSPRHHLIVPFAQLENTKLASGSQCVHRVSLGNIKARLARSFAFPVHPEISADRGANRALSVALTVLRATEDLCCNKRDGGVTRARRQTQHKLS